MVLTFLPNPNSATIPVDIIVQSAQVLDQRRLHSSLNEGSGQIYPALLALNHVIRELFKLNLITHIPTRHYQYYYFIRQVANIYTNLPCQLYYTNDLFQDVQWFPCTENNQYKITTGWWFHPATLMWVGHIPALCQYLHLYNQEWIRRGFNTYNFKYRLTLSDQIVWPEWFSDQRVFLSHRYSLYRKNSEFYQNIFSLEQYQQWSNIISQCQQWETILKIKLANYNYFWPRTPIFLQLE